MDRVEGEDAMMRVSDDQRVVVPSAPPRRGVAVGSTVLVAVRPERVAIVETGTPGTRRRGSAGTVAQIVYLGTLTQFHVETSIGKRFIVHRLSDDPAARITQGDRVILSWAREDGSILRSSLTDLSPTPYPIRALAPRFTSWSATMLRCTSLVPSQIRSTRTSR